MEAEDALYELPPEEFVAARDALARELRAAGDVEGARRVKGLRRPTVAAWAANLAVRRAPQAVEGLLELRDELQRAQRRLLSGRRVTDLTALTRQRRQQVDALVAEAEAALRAHGRDLGSHAEDVRGTFESVLGEDEAASRVREGRLERPLPAPAGFGTLAGLSAVPGSDDGGEGSGDDVEPADTRAAGARDGRLAEAQERRERAEASADAALERAREAEGEAAHLREEARTAGADARRSRREAEAAVSRAQQAEAAHGRAEEAADAAEARARRARDHADRALQEAEEAQRAVTALLGGP